MFGQGIVEESLKFVVLTRLVTSLEERHVNGSSQILCTRVWGLGLGFKGWGLGYMVWGLGFCWLV